MNFRNTWLLCFIIWFILTLSMSTSYVQLFYYGRTVIEIKIRNITLLMSENDLSNFNGVAFQHMY
jgi:hypothetical protein